MAKLFDRPIIIQKLNTQAKQWEDLYDLHASVNKAKANNEYLSAGAVQSKQNIVFEVRYFPGLDDIALNLPLYRILYRNVPYNIIDSDDFMFRHKTVKLSGVSY